MQTFKVLRAFGPKTIVRRVIHAVKMKSGLMERIDPHGAFGPTELSHHLIGEATLASMLAKRRAGQIPFFFQGRDVATLRPGLNQLISEIDKKEIATEVEGLERGRIRFFSRRDVEMGEPPRWQLNPDNNVLWPTDRHWRHFSQFDPVLGDIKMVWEANRFSQCYLLTRTYALSGDVHPLRLALRRMLEWIDANPPVYGVQWNCGQETSFRLMAWLFALHAAYGTDALDEASYGIILASIYRQAQRVERHIGFSRSIRNNHSLSEALGLYTVGLFFPEFDRSAYWRRRGLKIFVEDAMQQIASDGSFIQNSMNYHRVMLHDCLWLIRLGQLHGEQFPSAFLERVNRAVDFIYQMHDPSSGRVPNYGANDGARILPLDSCDYLDYRSTIQASGFLLRGRRLLPAGAWDEMALWLCGPEALRSQQESVALRSSRFDVGGYSTLRGRESWGMIRCHTYKERPAQADMLHFDLWWRGENILRDTGTYQYHCEPPWNYYFKSTRAHNTIAVDGQDQMTKGPRFVWFDWTQSKLLEHKPKRPEESERWSGEHYGYVSRLGVTHRRSIERSSEDVWRITDELLGIGQHEALLSWHLGDWPYEWNADEMTLELKSPVGMVYVKIDADGSDSVRAEVVRGLSRSDDVHGWESLYYGEKSPIPVLRVWLKRACPMRVVTHIGLGRKSTSSSRN